MEVKAMSFACLFLGFLMLFLRIRWLERITRLLKKTQADMEEAARQRSLESRKNLLRIQREHSVLLVLERELNYAGLQGRFPFYCAELWIAGNTLALTFIFGLALLFSQSAGWATGAGMIFILGEYLFIRFRKLKAVQAVNGNLIKFLDFLGNYSIAAGEVTGVFHQVSRYMEEPLKKVLDECYYEAQTTGDANLALLSMAEKIEHPKFKELARNLEISIRYCADFTALVQSSRKNMREYLRGVEERKSMLREGILNMLLLAAMSIFVLFAADSLIGVSMWEILRYTLPGKMAVGILILILALFLRKINGIHG